LLLPLPRQNGGVEVAMPDALDMLPRDDAAISMTLPAAICRRLNARYYVAAPFARRRHYDAP